MEGVVKGEGADGCRIRSSEEGRCDPRDSRSGQRRQHKKQAKKSGKAAMLISGSGATSHVIPVVLDYDVSAGERDGRLAGGRAALSRVLIK